MSTQEKKSKLLNFIETEADDDQLEYLYKLVSDKHEKDFWFTLSVEEKKEIEEGLEDVKNGDVVDHKTVMEQAKKWL
jgi:predicted transcriptional regulator